VTLLEIKRLRDSLKESAESQTNSDLGEFRQRLADEGQFQQLREVFADLPQLIQNKSQIELPKNDNEIDFHEILSKTTNLNTFILNKLQNKFSKIEITKIQKTFLTFHRIITDASEKLQQIEAEDELRRQAYVVAFRAQAHELGYFERLGSVSMRCPAWPNLLIEFIFLHG
jgi:hypothetical protein